MWVALVFFITFFGSLLGILYVFFTTRNRERMAMIEKGVDPALFSPAKAPRKANGLKFSLKMGTFLAGIGLGFIISVLLRELVGHDDELYPLLVIGIVFLCGGGGLVGGFYLGRNIDRREAKS